MERKPLIFNVNTEKAEKFCDNRCNNKECSKHLSKMTGWRGLTVISKLRDTKDCEGYISKWKQSHAEIEQIKAEMRDAGIAD